MIRRALALIALAFLSGGPLEGQNADAKPNPLLKEAKITEKAARQTALARVPNGRVTESELEKENGKLVWSFDIKVDGKPGVEEVQVDALTGSVASIEHESPESEAKEAKEEVAEKMKAKAKPKKKP